MKRSEMILKISKNLQKHENIFRGYKKDNLTLKCACDNLATYLLNSTEVGLIDNKFNKVVKVLQKIHNDGNSRSGKTYSSRLAYETLIELGESL